jgi:hypothetical protein
MSKKKKIPQIEGTLINEEKEVPVGNEIIDKVVVKNLSDGPRQFHLRDGSVVGCLPNNVSTPFLRKYLTAFLRKLEKEGKVAIISLGGA